MNRRSAKIAFGFLLATACAAPTALHAADLDGAMVRLERRAGAATVSARVVGPFRLEIVVNPWGETKPLAIRVELPDSGPRAWPAADVEVRDAQGRALAVRRSGTEWFKFRPPDIAP